MAGRPQIRAAVRVAADLRTGGAIGEALDRRLAGTPATGRQPDSFRCRRIEPTPSTAASCAKPLSGRCEFGTSAATFI